MVTPMAISQHAASRGDTGTRSAGCRSAPCAWCADNVALLAALAPLLAALAPLLAALAPLLAAAAPSARREKLVPPPTAAARAGTGRNAGPADTGASDVSPSVAQIT